MKHARTVLKLKELLFFSQINCIFGSLKVLKDFAQNSRGGEKELVLFLSVFYMFLN